MSTVLIRITLGLAACFPLLAGDVARAAVEQAATGRTTAMARQFVLERIDSIAEDGACRQEFLQASIDLDRLRAAAHQTRFYSAVGDEGDLRFSQVVGKPADPDQTIRALALGLAASADAFVLGYQDGPRYVRTKRVVLNRGYFVQETRPTTAEEKQSLLLHELLHIVLDKDDDDLTARALCPLRLLAFCRRAPEVSQR